MSGEQQITVRNLQQSDETDWRPLWRGYLEFYKHKIADDVTGSTWRRLLSDDPTFVGLAAEHEGRVIGIAHYILHPSTWSRGHYCYLEDLFVDPSARGKGAGRLLIEEIYRRADDAGWDRVYWITQEFNYKGRILYDKLARKTDCITYERKEDA